MAELAVGVAALGETLLRVCGEKGQREAQMRMFAPLTGFSECTSVWAHAQRGFFLQAGMGAALRAGERWTSGSRYSVGPSCWASSPEVCPCLEQGQCRPVVS